MFPCKHTNRQRVVSGAPALWCLQCGAMHDGKKWMHPPDRPHAAKKHTAKKHAKKRATHGPAKKR